MKRFSKSLICYWFETFDLLYYMGGEVTKHFKKIFVKRRNERVNQSLIAKEIIDQDLGLHMKEDIAKAHIDIAKRRRKRLLEKI